jgi:heat shock protein HslJ
MHIGRLAMIVALAAAPACAAIQLTGEWQVEDIGGMGVIDNSNVTLDFSEPGRIAGSAGCNNYTATLEAGDGLSIGPAAATRKMCPEALMNQEQRFFQALASVTRYERDATDALRLYTADGTDPVIVARQTNR